MVSPSEVRLQPANVLDTDYQPEEFQYTSTAYLMDSWFYTTSTIFHITPISQINRLIGRRSEISPTGAQNIKFNRSSWRSQKKPSKMTNQREATIIVPVFMALADIGAVTLRFTARKIRRTALGMDDWTMADWPIDRQASSFPSSFGLLPSPIDPARSHPTLYCSFAHCSIVLRIIVPLSAAAASLSCPSLSFPRALWRQCLKSRAGS